jgi:hypothetical protein
MSCLAIDGPFILLVFIVSVLMSVPAGSSLVFCGDLSVHALVKHA